MPNLQAVSDSSHAGKGLPPLTHGMPWVLICLTIDDMPVSDYLQNHEIFTCERPLLPIDLESLCFNALFPPPGWLQLRGTEFESHLNLLELFAYGTYSDYLRESLSYRPTEGKGLPRSCSLWTVVSCQATASGIRMSSRPCRWRSSGSSASSRWRTATRYVGAHTALGHHHPRRCEK
jgi:hypothetical protein